AIVENQTDNDWNDVELSLVSGRPMSFVMDLYQPLYVQRPLVVPDLFRSLVPQAYGEGMGLLDEEKNADLGLRTQAVEQMRRAAPGNRGFAGGAAGQAAPQAPAADAAARERLDAATSVQSIASAADLGELFEYVVGEVDIVRQSS